MSKENSFSLSGIVHQINETQRKSEKFSVREFVLNTQDGNYPQYVTFQTTNDRCDLLDRFATGQLITVHFDVRGRQWQDKFFNTLNAWRIESMETAPGTQPANEQQAPMPEAEPITNEVANALYSEMKKEESIRSQTEPITNEVSDDLPF